MAGLAKKLCFVSVSMLLAACGAGDGAAADAAASVGPAACSANSLALQILGSGGPIADDDRASASNLVWVDGKARLLVDAGGGTFLRYSEARAKFADLDAILLTHLHGDHAAGLPAILNAGSFEARKAALPIIGPGGGPPFPDMAGFLAALIGPDGAFAYLAPYLDGSGDLPRLEPRSVDPAISGLQRVLEAEGLTVDATGVHHLDVPALGYVVRVGDKTIVFAGDQSFQSEAFVEALKGSAPDLLVMHDAINMDPGQPRGLHRDPRSIGETAAALGAKTLVLTHHMQRALMKYDQVEAAIRETYAGPIVKANDLECVGL